MRLRDTPGRFLAAFERHPPDENFSDYFHSIAKTLLEFIRNIAVVGAIKFFATRADSLPLHVVAEIGKLAVAATVATFITRYHFTGWNMLEDAKLRRVLNFIYSTVPGVVAYFALTKFIDVVTGEIVKSQMIH
jgi:hypothetical protein